MNSKHVHSTCKICRGKGYIDAYCKYKDPNYYNKIGQTILETPIGTIEALPMPTSMLVLIKIAYKSTMNKYNNLELKMKNKVK